MTKLEEIVANSHVTGIEPGGPVRVLFVEKAGTHAINVTYKRLGGQPPLEKTLFRTDEKNLALVSAERVWPFDAPAADFKLAAEATRIRLAYNFDPMMAVHTSNVEPLPHQIAAVYESMLPKQPLRYVLADDPGAGKTIMAGLLIRELMLRGDLHRCLIVAPGSLVEQWQTELSEKFGLRFDLLTGALVESTATGNAFAEHDLLIARIDQLARNDAWQDKLGAEAARWDLVVVDEAHKMAAHFRPSGELDPTLRYRLGKLVGSPDRTRNLLLMTATPHNGYEDDFQAFMALIDPDRFYGRARDGGGKTDVSDLMRRMVKEDLVKFDGTKLFPERRATTLVYHLTPAEQALYDGVTDYVRTQMGRADAIANGKKRAVVGFALTILQRRLASSPWAIARSLERRRQKLQERIDSLDAASKPATRTSWEDLDVDLSDLDDDASAEELEKIEAELVDEATAATTRPELQGEVELLKDLEKQARAVVSSNVDCKWDQLSSLLQSTAPEMFRPDGRRRKMIIFTEHRDTLDYLKKKTSALLGKPGAVIELHGGTRREDRIEAQEQFRQNPEVVLLLATDAAGEGVNLQVANLMVNYDLPWNPNRIEQRFGRIHRIGQEEVCHLWNLVAIDTREGQVFERLFDKLNQARESLGGRVFDVLGQTFHDRSLKELLIEAVRYGEDPEVQARRNQAIAGAFQLEHIREIIDHNALSADVLRPERLYQVKEQMERAEARKLQPSYLRRFLVEALDRQHAELREREPGRYEIRHVPANIRRHNAVQGGRRPVLETYDRVTFEREKTRILGKPPADLIHPGHPLMAAAIELTLESTQAALERGTVLVDPHDPGSAPRVLFMLDHVIREGVDPSRHASERMLFVELDAQGRATSGGAAPYLDYEALAPADRALVDSALAEPWLKQDLSQLALTWAAEHLVPEHFKEVQSRREITVDKTQRAVHERLTKEINHWARRAVVLAAEVKAGKQPRLQPDNARKRVEELKARLEHRTRELEGQLNLASNPPVVVGCALIVPQGMVDALHNEGPLGGPDAAARKRIELAAMDAVMAAERMLGNDVKDVSVLKCGWDITSVTPANVVRHIEVKGREASAVTVTVTANEILQALNQGDKFIMAIVRIDGDVIDGPHYVRRPFTKEPEVGAVSVNYALKDLLARAKSPAQA